METNDLNKEQQKRIKILEEVLLHANKKTARLSNIVDSFIRGSQNVFDQQGFADTSRSLFELCKKQIGAKAGHVAVLSDDDTKNKILFIGAGNTPIKIDEDLQMPAKGLRELVCAQTETIYDNDFENSKWMKSMPREHIRIKNIMFTPLIYDKKPVGLLAIANKSSDFTEEDAKIASTFGRLISIALREEKNIDEAKKTESAFRNSEEKYRTLFNTMNEGVCLNEVIFDKSGKPADYRILDVNSSYEKLTGIKKEHAQNKKASKVYKTETAPFLDICSRVAETGIPETFDRFWEPIQKHFLISVFSPQRGKFATIFTDITGQKEKEHLLRISEEYLVTTLNSIGDAVITTDTQGKIVRINPVAESLTGWKSSDAEGLSLNKVFKIINQKTKEKVENPVDKVLRMGVIAGLANHTVLISRDGTEYFIDDSGAPIKDKNSQIIGVVLIFRDITEKYLAQEAIAKNEKKYRQLFEKSTDGIFIMEKETHRILDANKAALKITGYKLEELKGMAIHEISFEITKENYKKIFMSDESLDLGETVYTRKDKAERIVRVSLVPLDATSLFIIAQDITQEKKAEAKQKKLQAQLSNAMELAHLGPWEYDVINDIFTFNDNFYKIFHTTAEQVGGYTMSSSEYARLFVHPDDINVVREEIQKSIEATDPNFSQQLEHRILYADGNTGHISVRIVIVKDTSGRTVGTYGVNQDITERKIAEEDLKESKEKLMRAKKMESLGLLAGGVAHDLNNVLSGIVSYPELLLLDLPEDSSLRQPIETIQKSGNKAVEIVQDLLTIARGIASPKEPLNLNNVIDEYLSSLEFKKLLQFHPTVKIKPDLDTSLLNIDGSLVHLRKLIMNLVSNASEAIEGIGNVTISTSNCYVDRPLRKYEDVNIGEYALLTVSDDGSGITQDYLDRIFEPFFTKKVMGMSGTGLGLTVVWSIVQDHEGYIDVESGEEGTSFRLYFPITRNEIEIKESSKSIEDLKGNGETILVVDDVSSQREISSSMLNALGYKSIAVNSGENAVEYLKKNKVDLVLLDMIMDPGINGRETYKRIVEFNPGQKAIIVSGFAKTDEVKEAQKLGAGPYVKKPLTFESLGRAIKTELEK